MDILKMPELIDRELTLILLEGTIKHFDENWLQDKLTKNGLLIAKQIVSKQPTIEAEPVRHAYWEPSEVGEYHCTHCGVECDIDEFHKALLNPFCGNCGARMDGGADNATD